MFIFQGILQETSEHRKLVGATGSEANWVNFNVASAIMDKRLKESENNVSLTVTWA